MLVAAAVLPHPPMLVPEIAAGAASELDGMRASCRAVLDTVCSEPCDRLVVVASGTTRATYGPGARGSLAGFGVQAESHVPGSEPSGPAVLPVPATIACWLLENHDSLPPVTVEVLPPDLTPEAAAALGGQVAELAPRVAVLAMGDGSAALSVRAPGYLVDGAEQWQEGVTAALGSANHGVLAALSVADATAFVAAGRPAWQVLAGAAASSGRWTGQLAAAEAPYGVAYVAVSWHRAA